MRFYTASTDAASSRWPASSAREPYRNVASAAEIVEALRDVSQSQHAVSITPHESLTVQLGRDILQRLSAEAAANLIAEYPQFIAPNVHGEARAIDLRFLHEPIGAATATIARSHLPAFLADDLHAVPSFDPKFAYLTVVELQHTLRVAEARHTHVPGFAAPEGNRSELYQAHRASRKPAHASVQRRVIVAARQCLDKPSTDEVRDLRLLLSREIPPELRAAAHAWQASRNVHSDRSESTSDALQAESLGSDPDVFALAEFCLAECGHGDRRTHLLNAHKLCVDPELHYRIERALDQTSSSLTYLQEARRLAPDNAAAASCELELSRRDPARGVDHIVEAYRLQPTPENEFNARMATARETTCRDTAMQELRCAMAAAQTNEQRAEAHLMYVVHQLDNVVEHASEVSRLTENNEDRAFAEYTLARYRHGDQAGHLANASIDAESPHLQALIRIEFARLESDRSRAYDCLERACAFVRDPDIEHELALAYGRLAGHEGRPQLHSVIDFSPDPRLRAEAHLAIAELGEHDAAEYAREALRIARVPEIRAAAAYTLAKLHPDMAAEMLQRAHADVQSTALAHKIFFALGLLANSDDAAIAHFAQAASYASDSQTFADCHYQIALRNSMDDSHWREVWKYSSETARHFEAALAIGTGSAVDRGDYLEAAISLAPTEEQRAALHLIAGASLLKHPYKAHAHFNAARNSSADRETQAYAEIGAGISFAPHRVAHLKNAKKLTTDPRLKETIRTAETTLRKVFQDSIAGVRQRAIERDREAEVILREALTCRTVDTEKLKSALSLATSNELRASIHQALSNTVSFVSEQRYHLATAIGLTHNRVLRRTCELALSARLTGEERAAALKRALACSDNVPDRAAVHRKLAQLNHGDVLQHLLQATKSRLMSDEAGEAELQLALTAREPVLEHLRHALHATRDSNSRAVVEALLGVRLAERNPRSASAISHFREALTQTGDEELRTYIALHLAKLDESARGEHLAAARRWAPSRQALASVELESARQAQIARDNVTTKSMMDLNGAVLEHILRADRLADDNDTRRYARKLRTQAVAGRPAAAIASRLPDILRKSLYAMQSGQVKSGYRSDMPSDHQVPKSSRSGYAGYASFVQ